MGSVAGAPRTPIRILYDFPDLYDFLYVMRNIVRINIRKDMRKEIRIRILLKPPRGEDRRPTILE